MSDFRNDPNFPQSEMREYDSRVQWAAVAVILLLLGGMIVAATWTGDSTQTAANTPAVETTGSGAAIGSAQGDMTLQSRRLRPAQQP